ncbi:MAG: transposase [Bacillota bacterium]
MYSTVRPKLKSLRHYCPRNMDAHTIHFSMVQLDEFIFMPNHIHGIIFLYYAGDACVAPTKKLSSKPVSIGSIIGSYKSAVAKQINKLRVTPGTPVWQRNYYEHVIRRDESLDEIRQYIVNNPAKWATDPENLYR